MAVNNLYYYSFYVTIFKLNYFKSELMFYLPHADALKIYCHIYTY